MTHSSENSPLPLVVLAGSDPEPAALPAEGAALHPLKGAKAISVKVDHKPILDVLLERLRASRFFEPIYIAGPVALLGQRHAGSEVIDTDGTFGENLRAAVEHLSHCHPSGPLAITTCDILPELEDLERVMEDFFRHVPVDFWFPVIQAPPVKRLGASSWKPRYRLIAEGSDEAVSMLPGHLVIADPRVLRLPLIYRSFELAYETRNTAVMPRLWRILGGVLSGLLVEDARSLLRFKLPAKTITVTYHGIALALELRGDARQEDVEKRVRGIFVRHRHRRRNPQLRGRIPLMKALSLAKDIDTQEEADEAAARVEH